MTMTDLLADECARNGEFLKNTIGDFSDADLLVRPCPGANHAAWQIGHLIVSEANFANILQPGSAPELPAGFAAKFSKDASKSDDPVAFPKKAELLDLFTLARAGTVAAIRSLKDEDLNKPAPERMRAWLPTMSSVAMVTMGHLTMHIGQFQVIRRKLGKPILF